MSAVKLIPKEYIAWNSRFNQVLSLRRLNYTVPNPSLVTQKDLIPLYASTFHYLLGSLIRDDLENIRQFHNLSDAIEAFIIREDGRFEGGWFKYAGENSLEKDRKDLEYILTIFMHQGILEPNLDIWESELIVPEDKDSSPFAEYLNSVSDIQQYLLSLCRYFRKNIILE